MHTIKKHLTLLTTLLLVLLMGTGCSEDSSKKPTLPDDLTIDLSFAGGTDNFEGLKAGIRYYFEPTQKVDLTLIQGGKEVTLEEQPLTDIDANQSTAKVRIPLTKLSGIDPAKPYRISATLAGQTDRFGSVTMTEEMENTPIHLLKYIPVPMTAEVDAAKGFSPAVMLRREGTLFLLRTYNATAAPLTVDHLAITVGDRSLEGDWSKTILEPKTVTKTLLWLPVAEAREVTLTYDAVSTESVALVADGSDLTATFTLPDAVTTEEVEEVPVEPADDANGGDPYFCERDVAFWVGEGPSKSYFVLDFHLDDFPQALVWGYRWTPKEDEMTITSVQDMVFDIVRADPRLCLLLDKGSMYGNALLGVGYLHKDSSEEAKVLIGDQPAKAKEPRIYVLEDTKLVDQARLSISDGLWRAGWGFDTIGYWSLQNKSSRLDRWSYSGSGMTGQPLSDGSWHAFSFQVGWESWEGAPPSDKFVAAEPPMDK